jgi:hypothetical protein
MSKHKTSLPWERKRTMRCWFLSHDAGDLIHITTGKMSKKRMRKRFPEFDITELTHAISEQTFYIKIDTDTTVEVR